MNLINEKATKDAVLLMMAALVVDFLKRNFLRSSVRVGSISQTLTF